MNEANHEAMAIGPVLTAVPETVRTKIVQNVLGVTLRQVMAFASDFLLHISQAKGLVLGSTHPGVSRWSPAGAAALSRSGGTERRRWEHFVVTSGLHCEIMCATTA